jgi:lipopolysaccharide export LptBFGC system permease protein LptF
MALAPNAVGRPGRTVYRYLAREIATPTLFALLGLTAVVLTRDFMGLSELVINRGVSTFVVLKIAACEAIPLAARMFPFSVLIGCLVALGRLGSDREVLALESLGITGAALVWPVAAFAAVMTVASLFFSLVAAPRASRELDASLERIAREMPWANVRAGQVSEFGGWQLEAREVNARGDELQEVLLWMPRLGETVFARAGHMSAGQDGSIEIVLEDGSSLARDPARERPARGARRG